MSIDARLKTRLVCQLSVIVESKEHGKILYDDLKHYLSVFGSQTTLSGQVTTPMEPCCTKSKPPEKKTH